jgi:hypothetical protein
MTIAGLFTRERTNPEPGSHRILDCYGRTMGKEQWSAVLVKRRLIRTSYEAVRNVRGTSAVVDCKTGQSVRPPTTLTTGEIRDS